MSKFLIIASGYNCERNIKSHVDALKKQTFKGKFTAVLINDGSTDRTGETLMMNVMTHNSFIIGENFSDNRGAAYRRYQAIKKYCNDPETIIVLVGLDDFLLPNALDKIDQQYQQGKWMTYGNWIDSDGVMLPDGFLDFDDNIHVNRNYRKVKYRSTGPNTFKKFLFDQLTEDDFKFRGEWVKATTESNLMFSCLEMCGDKNKIGIIKEPICLYNRRPDSARRRFGNEYQDSIFNNVISLPKKPKYEKP